MGKLTTSAAHSGSQSFTTEALFEQGMALHQQGQLKQAKQIYEQVLQQAPKHFDALRLLGVLELQSGHPLQALACIDAAIQINPNRADAYYDRGVTLFDLKRFEDAVASYDIAIARDANYADAYLSRGNALFTLSKFEEAALSYERALQITPDHAGAYSNWGAALYELQRWAEALDCYNKAIELQPHFVDALCNRGNAMLELDRTDEALADYRKVLELQPDHAKAYCSRGNAFLAINQLAQALESYDKAINLQSEFAEAQANKSRVLLLSGNFQLGWPLYEWRWRVGNLAGGARFAKPLWLGEEDIANKTILLHAEQGLGDTIQFCRYAKLVKAKGARVMMAVPPALLALLEGLDGVDEWVIENQSVPAFDYHCPLLSLPLAFKTDLNTIPSPGAYLKTNAQKCNTWAQRLGEKTKPRVGLVWSGSTIHKNDRNRSMRLQEVLQHLPAGCEYVSLQKELREIDKEVLASSSVKFYGDELLDFTDTAALCAQMDVVVSVDTSVAHLAGALGKTTWLLLPYAPDWRWLLDRDDSPWYASMKLYRQGADRQWAAVLRRVAADLTLLAQPMSGALFEEGLALFQQGQLKQAKQVCQQILKLKPKHVDTLRLMSVVESQLGNVDLALQMIDAAIQVNSHSPEAHYDRGLLLSQLKRQDEAVICYDKAIALQPGYVDAHLNRGNVLFALGRFEDAIVSYEKVTEILPNHVGAYSNRGVAFFQLQKWNDALVSYKRAIELGDHSPDAFCNLGGALHALERFEEAIESYGRAIELQPNYVKAICNLGGSFLEAGRLDEALASYDKAIQLEADCAVAFCNRGSVFLKLNRLEESLENHDKAIEFEPNHVNAHCNRGNTLLALGRLDDALESYDKAIGLEPEFASAYFNKSIVLLQMANFQQGWLLYEWRWKDKHMLATVRQFKQPLWLGEEDIANKTVLLHAEQGLGDTIQFCRYAKWVKAKGARVVMAVPPALLLLLEGLEGVDEWVIDGQALPAFDYHCPLMSLPLAFKTELNTMPSPNAYLQADANKCNTWAQRLGEKTKPRVGLVWSGSTIHKNDRNRSMRLQEVLQHLPAGCEYVSLQKEVREADREVLASSGVRHYGDALVDFTDTAALCELMDVVVSVDTSVAHLAGALGKVTWLLLPYVPDWRWLLDRDDSPWYASMKLYRQGADRQWAAVLQQVAADLVLLVGR